MEWMDGYTEGWMPHMWWLSTWKFANLKGKNCFMLPVKHPATTLLQLYVKAKASGKMFFPALKVVSVRPLEVSPEMAEEVKGLWWWYLKASGSWMGNPSDFLLRSPFTVELAVLQQSHCSQAQIHPQARCPGLRSLTLSRAGVLGQSH